ncbi:hypothetical protein WA1_47710 [Scytonema hofmannii PCC 7110]|uniref:DUF928 domain-containing protein n=1 Tax=Scytonema hofmannii PCC 7110 TaxID=128403 RepID=A0A139WXY6_9CYAN|nr:DUF928 domain-containing protein [Scytonema hofmannii]KYC37309.1 hypothetical protein WA1_47710 [Scytonema hofmannii PCC 7110]
MFFNSKVVSLSIAFALASFVTHSPQTFAQPVNVAASNPEALKVNFSVPNPPPTGGTDTRGAGDRRGDELCPNVNIPLTILTPNYKTPEGKDFFWGQTVDAQPTFWMYVPYSLTNERPGELRLEETDASGNTSLTTVAKVVGTSTGVVGVRLPGNKTLEKNKVYYWQFAVICNKKKPSANQFASATITRIDSSPTLTQQLTSATPKQKAALYAKEGLWYDTVTNLAGLSQANPGDTQVQKTWQELLRSVGLNTIADQPIVLQNTQTAAN